MLFRSGQDAVNTAREFNERLDFSGVILTKLDGDTRGGAALLCLLPFLEDGNCRTSRDEGSLRGKHGHDLGAAQAVGPDQRLLIRVQPGCGNVSVTPDLYGNGSRLGVKINAGNQHLII